MAGASWPSVTPVEKVHTGTRLPTFRWSLPVTPRPGLELQVRRQADEAYLTVEAITSDGEPEAGLRLEAIVASPGGDERVVPLRETAPGRYQAGFTTDAAGDYRVRVVPPEQADSPYQEASATLHVAYPARYTFGLQGVDRLLALSQATGGRVLLGDEPLFAGPAPLRFTVRAGQNPWALLALVAFMTELLMRYLPVRLRLRRPGVTPPSLSEAEWTTST